MQDNLIAVQEAAKMLGYSGNATTVTCMEYCVRHGIAIQSKSGGTKTHAFVYKEDVERAVRNGNVRKQPVEKAAKKPEPKIEAEQTELPLATNKEVLALLESLNAKVDKLLTKGAVEHGCT